MTDIRIANRSDTGLLPDLCELLKGAVEGGASVGFMAPLSAEAADAYWRDVLASIGQSLMVWVALENGRAIGSVQLALCQRGNGRHRGEVQKLLVLGTHRRRGIAQRLMGELEASARAAGRSLLVLDTQKGSAAETLYQTAGWSRAGEIPDFALAPYGGLQATSLYFKQLVA